MPFIASLDGERVFPEQIEDEDAELECIDCGSRSEHFIDRLTEPSLRHFHHHRTAQFSSNNYSLEPGNTADPVSPTSDQHQNEWTPDSPQAHPREPPPHIRQSPPPSPRLLRSAD